MLVLPTTAPVASVNVPRMVPDVACAFPEMAVIPKMTATIRASKPLCLTDQNEPEETSLFALVCIVCPPEELKPTTFTLVLHLVITLRRRIKKLRVNVYGSFGIGLKLIICLRLQWKCFEPLRTFPNHAPRG